MHEVGIITQAVDIALESARREGASRITMIRLKVGALAGVVPEALEFGFDVVTRGTLAEGATLLIDEVQARCLCTGGCGEFEPDCQIYACPICGQLSSDILAGRELDIVEIELTAS